MARRTMTVKRIDPWSVLKVGFLANLVLLGILLLAGRVVWFFVERLELIGRACELAESVGFQDCGLNGGNIFRSALLLGLLGVVGQTGILVFVAFLHNLIAELTGGLQLTVVDDSPEVASSATRSGAQSAARPGPASASAGARPGPATPRPGPPSGQGAPRPSAPAAGQSHQPRPADPRPADRPTQPVGGQATQAQPPVSPSGSPPHPGGDPTQVARPATGNELFRHDRPQQDPARPHGPSRP